MSKQLLIFRHAKSDWANADISDFNRPLNSRGLVDAPAMGKRLKALKIKPEMVISSPAMRALSTAKLVCHEINFPIEAIQTNKSIYDATCSQLLKLINNFDNGSDVIALFGHNNGITDLAVYLTDEDIFNIPTCGMVLISFPFDDWAMVSKSNGEMVLYDFPKNIQDNE